MKMQTERLIQTAIHSNPRKILSGSVANAVGVITISFGVAFIRAPIVIGLTPLNTTAASTVRHISWVVDAVDSRLHTGMRLDSNGVGDIICYCVEGIVRE
ncbi:MAG: hypothetical protein DDT40_01199 [candidate division WS2 bacterium]|nr:hypothetical protein [Candidatus Psychracetigena formicireducens]